MSWISKQNIGPSSASDTGLHVDYDNVGRDIFFTKVDGSFYQVFKYNVDLDTITQLSNSTSFDSGDFQLLDKSCPLWFEENLYVLTNGQADTTLWKIYKYSGTGTSWASVLSVTLFSLSYLLARTSTQLVLTLKDANAAQTFVVKHTTDGSSWSDGTVDSTPAPPAGSYNLFSFTLFNENGTYDSGLIIYDIEQFGVISPTPYIWKILKWDNISQWVTQFYYTWDGSSHTGSSWIETLASVDMEYWDLNNFYADVLNGTFIEPGNSGPYPVNSCGFNSLSIGGTFSSGTVNFHIMDSGTWDAGEAVDSGLTSGKIRHVVRFYGGDTFIFVKLNTTVFIYARSEPIDDGDLPPDPEPDPSVSGVLFCYGYNNINTERVINLV